MNLDEVVGEVSQSDGNEVPVNARSEVERKARAYDALTAALLLLGQLSSQSIRNILEKQK